MNRWVLGGVVVLLIGSVVGVQALEGYRFLRIDEQPDSYPPGQGGVVLRALVFEKPAEQPLEPQPVPGIPTPGQNRSGVAHNESVKLDFHGDPLPPGAVARYGTVRLRHGQEPSSLRFSPDGKFLASISNMEDGIRLWDPLSGKELHRLHTHINFAAFGRDGSMVLLTEGRGKFWIPAANLVREYPEKCIPESVQAVAVNPDLRSFAVGAPNKIVLIDLQSGKHLRELKVPNDTVPTRLVFSPDGRWLAGSGQNSGVWLWDLRTFRRVRTYRADVDNPEFAFSPEGGRLAITADQLRLFTTDSEEPVDEFKSPEGLFVCPRFSADGKMIFGMNQQGDVTQFDAATGEIKETYNAPAMNLRGPFAMMPDASRAAAVDDSGGLRIWEPKTGKGPSVERLPIMQTPGFSSDGKTVWCLSVDRQVHRFDAATGKPGKPIELPAPEDVQVQWDPTAQRAVMMVGGESLEAQIIDVETKKVVAKLPVPPNIGLPNIAFCASDRNRIVMFGVGVVQVVNAVNGKTVRTLSFGRPEDTPQCEGAISPDGRLLAINTRPISIWEVSTGKKRMEFDSLPVCTGATFTADGRYLAAWNNNGDLAVVDVRLGTVVRRFESGRGIHTAAFSPDGKRIATGEDRGTISVWEITTGNSLVTFARHDSMVSGLAWSPDGMRLASVGLDAQVLVWELPAKPNEHAGLDAVTGFDDAIRLLGSTDANAAQRGMEFLYRRPAETPKQLGEKIAIPARVGAGRIDKLIADLGDEDFPTREAAAKALEAIGGEATASLRIAAEQSTNPEARKLAGEVLTRIESGTPKADELRGLRAVEVLEGIGSAEARAVLAKWAAGPTGTRLATEAATAAARLKAKGN